MKQKEKQFSASIGSCDIQEVQEASQFGGSQLSQLTLTNLDTRRFQTSRCPFPEEDCTAVCMIFPARKQKGKRCYVRV